MCVDCYLFVCLFEKNVILSWTIIKRQIFVVFFMSPEAQEQKVSKMVITQQRKKR